MFTTVLLSVIRVPLDCSAWDLCVEIYNTDSIQCDSGNWGFARHIVT